MRIFKYLKKHAGAVLLIFMLLFGQAFCDLMLPNYTSQIVDVGIQQGGVEHVAAERLTAQTYDEIAPLVEDAFDSEAYELLEAAYDQAENGSYELTEIGMRNRAQLDDIMALPLAQRWGFAQDGMSEELVAQAGLAATRSEYEALGYDMGAMQLTYLLITGLKMMGFVALGALVSVLVGLVASRTGAKVGRELRERLFAKVMSFSDAEVQKFSAASLITRATNDVQQIQMMCIMLLRMVLYAPILGLGGIIMVARTDSSMGWIVGVAILAVIVVVAILMVLAVPKFKIMQKLVDRVNLVSRERLTGVQVVRAFGQQAGEQARFDIASTDLMRTQLFTNRVMTFMMPSIFLIMNIVSIAIVWVGAGQVDAGVVQAGDLIAFITYSMMIMLGFVMLSMLAIIAPRADVSAGRIDEVLEAEVSIVDPAGNPEKNPAATSLSSGATIEFDHVSFGYGDSSENVLSDVTFTAEAGQTCAIIGPTGSGKSTILKLIERFYDVREGRILVDGVDVRDWRLADLRAQLGYVPQRAFLFTGTIASNVGYAHEQVDEARILDALDIAQAMELVHASEQGVDAEITQGGTNVSGGQRQRLAIARALASDARAFLFDDSFSALDYKTDAALRKALSQRLPGKTQLIVAQRIATVMQAQKIIVLDEGCVVGQGTHAELLATCTQYREIAYSQLSPEELVGQKVGPYEDLSQTSSSQGGERL